MRKLRKGLTWLSVLVFFLGIGILSTTEVEAATYKGNGSPEKPFVTNGKSIEKYFFDTYNNKDEVKKAYDKYQAFAKANDKSPWYIRLGDSSKLSTDQIALNGNDGKKDGYEDHDLYVCWISYLKRAGTSKDGTLDECMKNTSAITTEKRNESGSSVYYNTFGYGLRSEEVPASWFSSAKLLGENADTFEWYKNCRDASGHYRTYATPTKSADASEFWMYTGGNEWGYTIYYIKYSDLYDAIDKYNKQAKVGFEWDYRQEGKYQRYDIYLNGSVALHTADKWHDNSSYFDQNSKYLKDHLGSDYLNKYAEQNYNRHIKIHVLNAVPIVVRAWDITTNQLVYQTIGSKKDYYMQAFDPALKDVADEDAVLWNTDSSTHTTDVQHAMLKFLYQKVKTGKDGKLESRGKVACKQNEYSCKTLPINSFIKRVNMGLIEKSDLTCNGNATVYLDKLEGMTTSDKALTADAYALTGFRVFGYDATSLEDLQKNEYKALRNYDPVTKSKAVKDDFKYGIHVSNYCLKVTSIEANGEKIRALPFDVRKNVKTPSGDLSYLSRVPWPSPQDENNKVYDCSVAGHKKRDSGFIASTFFTTHALTTRLSQAKDKSTWKTVDGTRYIAAKEYRAALGSIENSKKLVSIKEVAEGLGAKTSTFELKKGKSLNVENPSCIVVDILVSEMYYEQETYNVEQLAVTDNKYDNEHGVWGYTGAGEATLCKTDANGNVTKTAQSLPSTVHAESDDSQTNNTVSFLDSFKKPTNSSGDGYLRLDINKYGKKEMTSKTDDGKEVSDGRVYTLEGWSHYVSDQNKDTSLNIGYMDSLNSKQEAPTVSESKFALYSKEWYARMDAFGDLDDNPDDGKLSNKVSTEVNLDKDSWTYNLFYVIKPPIVGIVYVYDESKNQYQVKHVSAKSYKTFSASSVKEAKQKAVERQLTSTGVSVKNKDGKSVNYILYDTGYHRAGDKIHVTVCGNEYYNYYTTTVVTGTWVDKDNVVHEMYQTIEHVDGIDLAGVYQTYASVDFYNDKSDLPSEGSYSGEVTGSGNPWELAGLYNYMGVNIKAAENTKNATYHWNSDDTPSTPKPTPRSDVSFDIVMGETATAIVAVYGGPTSETAAKRFKMRVQYLQYDGTKYKQMNLVDIVKESKEDKLSTTAEISVDSSEILDIGYKEFKQDDVPLSETYYSKPPVNWGQSKDAQYTLHPDQNRMVVYVILKKPPEKNWLTIVYLDAGTQELPKSGSSTFNYEYAYYDRSEGLTTAMTNIASKNPDWVGIAYGPDLPIYDQTIVQAGDEDSGKLTYVNPSPDQNPKTKWSLHFSATAVRSGVHQPSVSTDAAGRSIKWENFARSSYPLTDGVHGYRGCILYVLLSQQYVPDTPDRTKVKVDITVEKLPEHTIDWEKATKPVITDGTANVLSEADYSNLDISDDNDAMHVYLANDEINSTRAAYDPLKSIPTSEFVKQYAAVKKYETEWQYEKVTVKWTFTDETRVHHKSVGAHYCPGHPSKYGSWSHPCCCVHTCSGSNAYSTYSTVTRYTTYYRLTYGDVYVPKDITTFNDSFGTFGTRVYNKTLDKFGHATMLVKNNAYQNLSLGYHRLHNANVSYPKFDESKLYPWDYSAHDCAHSAHWGPHGSYQRTRENVAACTTRLNLAVGKENLYRSCNEAWTFGDGEGNFTVLSNSNYNHDNEKSRNYIADPPEAKYTLADGISSSYNGIPDTTKTYSEGCSYAFGNSYNQFYQNAIPIPIDTLNENYASKSYVHWKLHAQAKPHSTKQDTIMRIEADTMTVFTPTVNLDYDIVDESSVQKIDQNANLNFTMDNVFKVHIEATGENCSGVSYPGYGVDNYDRYLNKDVVDDVLQHVGYVKFPFPVIKKALVEGVTVDTYYKENTWIACKIGDTDFIPAYYKDELENVEVKFMNRAENVLVKNAFSYEAPGTTKSRLHDADNVDDMVQSALMAGALPDWERISYPVTNGAKVNSENVHTNYIATNVEPCNLYGRIYGFSIIDQTDYPIWRDTFRNSDGTLSMNKYTSGVRNRERWLITSDPLKTIATVKGSNKQYTSAGVLKPGYAIRYTFETVGNVFDSNDYVEITPKFYWVDSTGNKSGEVDVYYKERSSANAGVSLIKVGSEADRNNKKVLSMDSFGFGHDYNYYNASQAAGSGVGNVKDESGSADNGGMSYSMVQDTVKDNLVHASRILGYQTVKEYLSYKEELWYPSFTRMINKMQTYDGIRHATILSNGAEDQFTALKSAVVKHSDLLGVTQDDIYKRIQEWYGEFYLPSGIYVTNKGTDVSKFLTRKGTGNELTGNESCWKHDGYLAVQFNIITYRNGSRWLSYNNAPYRNYGENAVFAYDVSDMWEREGYVTEKTDTNGTTFSLEEGTTVLYQIGNPDGNSSTSQRTNPSAANDYEGAGTH